MAAVHLSLPEAPLRFSYGNGRRIRRIERDQRGSLMIPSSAKIPPTGVGSREKDEAGREKVERDREIPDFGKYRAGSDREKNGAIHARAFLTKDIRREKGEDPSEEGMRAGSSEEEMGQPEIHLVRVRLDAGAGRRARKAQKGTSRDDSRRSESVAKGDLLAEEG